VSPKLLEESNFDVKMEISLTAGERDLEENIYNIHPHIIYFKGLLDICF